MRRLVLIAGLLALPQAAWADLEGDKRACVVPTDPQAQIAACSRLLNSGRLGKREQAISHFNRGIGRNALNRHRRAIADYDRAIRLDPGHAPALNNRCYAYFRLKDYRRAIADLSRASGSIRAIPSPTSIALPPTDG